LVDEDETLDEDDAGLIEEYIDSGTDLWDRDLDLLDGAPKIETEALDPVDLRNLVQTAIKERLDLHALRGVEELQEAGREWLSENLATAGIEHNTDSKEG
jgi:hypothetical protein